MVADRVEGADRVAAERVVEVVKAEVVDALATGRARPGTRRAAVVGTTLRPSRTTR